MIDLDAEGFVRVENNKIPLRNYLFYLTYNDRATILNNMQDVDLSSKNIYKSSNDYERKLRNASARKAFDEKGEIVMSFSNRLCTLAVNNKFDRNLDRFKRHFQARVKSILDEHLEQPEYSIFIHDYDSTQMRVHAHVLYYPYLESKGSLESPDGSQVDLRPLKLSIDEGRLKSIKRDFNQYARELYSGLEHHDAKLGEDFAPAMADREAVFNLMRLEQPHVPSRDKKEIATLWPESTQQSLVKRVKDLLLDSTPKAIQVNKDYSVIVDYVYDFNDPDIRELLFGHAGFKKMLSTFSISNKSNPKFSAVFLKILLMNKDPEIINEIERLTNNSKGGELANIIQNAYSSSEGQGRDLDYDRNITRDFE